MTPKTLKKPREDIRKFLKKKGIPSLAKALTKVMPKKHKQRFEHWMLLCDFKDIEEIVKAEEKEGWELTSTLPGIVDRYYITLFFKRPV